MNIGEAKRLRQGQTIYSKEQRNADGTAMRARVTSVKTWKTRPDEVEVRFKHGMYDYGVLTPVYLKSFTTKEPARKKTKRIKVRG